jgi:micrococcal nuclease
MPANQEDHMPTAPSLTRAELHASLYHYRAKVTAVYDGDTCTVDLDLGLNIWIRGEKIRLNRINAPEMTGPDKVKGAAARDHLRSLVLNQDVILQTLKDAREKYGRYLGELWIEQAGAMQNVNDLLVAAGHAHYQRY